MNSILRSHAEARSFALRFISLHLHDIVVEWSDLLRKIGSQSNRRSLDETNAKFPALCRSAALRKLDALFQLTTLRHCQNDPKLSAWSDRIIGLIPEIRWLDSTTTLNVHLNARISADGARTWKEKEKTKEESVLVRKKSIARVKLIINVINQR